MRAQPILSQPIFPTAIADFSEAIRLDPKDALFYRNRGMAYKATRGFDRALWDYSKANALEREIRH
jgi:Flp pilus assembly protein TadD